MNDDTYDRKWCFAKITQLQAQIAILETDAETMKSALGDAGVIIQEVLDDETTSFTHDWEVDARAWLDRPMHLEATK